MAYRPSFGDRRLRVEHDLVFEYWMRFAPTMSDRVGLSAPAMMRAHDIVCSTMGWDWLEQQHLSGGSHRTITHTHPLFIALKGQTEGCIHEVLHLAAYLFAFRDDPGLVSAIASLRDAGKYPSAIAEMDLAWKFRNAGASVKLYPPTPNGIADFSVIATGGEHVVETSGFPSDPLRDNAMSFTSSMARTFGSAVQKAGPTVPLSLELDMEEISGEIRSAIYSAIKELVRAISSGGTDRVEQAYAFGRVVVRRTVAGERPRGDDVWTNAMRIGYARTAQDKMLGDASYDIEGPGSWIYLRDRSAERDPYERLRRKLKQESRQLSGCVDGMIILDIEALGLEVINNRVALEGIANEFSRQHRGSTTSVAFIVRPSKVNGQRGISGHYFPLANSALPTQFWERVASSDDSADLLSELRAF